MIVKHLATGLYHEAEETQSGSFTSCGTVLTTGTFLQCQGEMSLELAGESGCDGCKNPQPKQLVSTVKARRTGKTNRPQWRVSRNLVVTALENAQHAHKEIVAAIEWFQRGQEGQFVQTGLDRMKLAYRFLKESLVDFKMLDDIDLDDEE